MRETLLYEGMPITVTFLRYPSAQIEKILNRAMLEYNFTLLPS